jgi:uncharacterized Fe-S cluster protein YjdI
LREGSVRSEGGKGDVNSLIQSTTFRIFIKTLIMDSVIKHYAKGDVKVVWKSQHSTLCWKGLREVFDPQKSPWINMDGAEEKRIIEQVKKCPSGALSIEIKEP